MTNEEKYSSFAFLSTRLVLQALQALGKSSKQARKLSQQAWNKIPVDSFASQIAAVQIIRVKITATDVEFSSEDEGKVSQSSVHFPASYFSEFAFSGQNSTFSVQLGALLDALRVFAAMPDVAVMIAETADHLELEVSDVGNDTAMHMYAHVALLGVSPVVHLIDHWEAPATEFSATAATLREAVEDLEWPHSHVRLTVKAQPFQVNLTSRGNVGELDVTIPHHLLRNTRTHENSVSSCYTYKFMKAALSGVPGIKAEYNSQISMDKNGLLKVVHVVPCMRGGMEDMGASNYTNDIILTFLVQPMYIDELQEAVEQRGDDVGTQA